MDRPEWDCCWFARELDCARACLAEVSSKVGALARWRYRWLLASQWLWNAGTKHEPSEQYAGKCSATVLRLAWLRRWAPIALFETDRWSQHLGFHRRSVLAFRVWTAMLF